MSDYTPNPRTPPPGAQVPPPMDARRAPPFPERTRSSVVGIVAIAVFALVLVLGWFASQRDVLEAPAPVAAPGAPTDPSVADPPATTTPPTTGTEMDTGTDTGDTGTEGSAAEGTEVPGVTTTPPEPAPTTPPATAP